MRRLVIPGRARARPSAAAAGAASAASGSPAPRKRSPRVLNSTQFYQRLGRLAADEPLPFVGNVAFAAGAGRLASSASSGLSLENRALAFQREGNVFVARYRVSLSFKREGAPSVDVAREEIVRVPTFQETQRADESILFQQVLRLAAGHLPGQRDGARRRAPPPRAMRRPITPRPVSRPAPPARRSSRTRRRGGGT